MLSIPKYPEQYAQHFLAIFSLLCCAFQHHVIRAAKTDGTLDGRVFTTKKPSSSGGAPAVPPPSSSRATPPSLFFLVPLRCACCGKNICGNNYSC